MDLVIDHIQLAIPKGSEDEAREFWTGRVGLEEITKPVALQARGGCWFRLGGQELHLGIETPFSPARKAHPGFLVDDIKALARRLGHVTWDDAIAGRVRLFNTDPFGNRLEFIQAEEAVQ